MKKAYWLLSCILAILMTAGCTKKSTESSIETPPQTIAPPVITTQPSETQPVKQKPDNHDAEIYSLVCSSVEYQLTNAGFTVGAGIASTEKNTFQASGLYFYSPALELLDNNYQSVGFMEISSTSDPYSNGTETDEMITVTASNESEDISRICAYNYNEIGSSHFVYKNQYVTYYQQSPMRVIYDIQENKPENYDMELGSIFDYDTMEYIYDETLFEESYQMHSAVPLEIDIDYAQLEKELQAQSQQQEKNGYSVEAVEIAYISLENLQAYIDSQAEDTFFGYPVSELTKAFGEGTALEYKNGSFKKATCINNERVKWGSFLADIGTGVGMVIVTTTIESKGNPQKLFSSLLINLAEPLTNSAAKAFTELATKTAFYVDKGYSVEEALKLSISGSLNQFSSEFHKNAIEQLPSAFKVCSAAVKLKSKNTNSETTKFKKIVSIGKDVKDICKSVYNIASPALDCDVRTSAATIVSHTDSYHAQKIVNEINTTMEKIEVDPNVLKLKELKKDIEQQTIRTVVDNVTYLSAKLPGKASETVTVSLVPWLQKQI